MRTALFTILFFSKLFVADAQVPGNKNLPVIRAEKDSATVQFLYKDSATIKSVRLVSDLITYFDNGINTKPQQTGFLTKDENGWWSLTVKLPNTLRIPYRYAVTVSTGQKDSVYEVTDPYNKNVYLKGKGSLEQSVLVLGNAFPYDWENEVVAPKWQKVLLPNSGEIYVYTPPGFSAASTTKYPLFIGLGSFGFGVEMPTASVYETLLAQSSVRPCILILADFKNLNSIADFDSASNYITNQVLPYARAHYHVSNSAKDIVIGGMSRRALVAAYIAYMNSDHIGNVLSLSGGYYWKPANSRDYEWLTNKLATSTTRKIKWYLSAGDLETMVTTNNAGHYMLATNRHLRNVLAAKNYPYLYEELPGGHNTVNWQHGLYNGFSYLLAK